MALAAGRPVPQDLLGILLTAADEHGRAMTDEELWEDVHDVMGAGGSGRGTHPMCVWCLRVCVCVGGGEGRSLWGELGEGVHDVMGAGGFARGTYPMYVWCLRVCAWGGGVFWGQGA